ncbi:MAG: hypothetical protein NPIRA04_34640 [Nitrospirales bacterium]|nr:MAG: hypothetical protein NPIRA04_34640 [Nitrospirales bacterium]
MAYLMHICFDNSHRLLKDCYLFEYRGVRFKLVQNSTRQSADHLLTIVSEKDADAQENAFSKASEFLSAVGWENCSRVAVWLAGGVGCPDEYPLEKANPSIRTFPRVSFAGSVFGFDLKRIPNIETDEQRIALALFREANASNNDYLSFLFFWQILQVENLDPKSFVDKCKDDHHILLKNSDIDTLAMGSGSLGKCLEQDYRHAIAHITRSKGKKPLDLNKLHDRMRLTISSRIIKDVAVRYIRTNLKLANHLYLTNPTRGNFSEFLNL